jgi:hypothetical protein
MTNHLLPPPADREPEPPYVERVIQREAYNLNRAASVLRNALIDFCRLDSHEASEGFNVARHEPEKIALSAQAVRSKIKILLKEVGASDFLDKTKTLDFNLERGPSDSLKIARRLITGLTGCRNAIQELLKHDPSLLVRGLAQTNGGVRQLQLLASIHNALDLKFADPEDVKRYIKMQRANAKPPKQKPIRKEAKHRSSIPIDRETLSRLSEVWENMTEGQIQPTVHEVGKEIILHQEDLMEGNEKKAMTFGQLRDLFKELTNKQLKGVLKTLEEELAKHGTHLVGELAPRGYPPISLEMDQQEPSTQSKN